MDNLKIPFKGSDTLQHFYSQAGQDLFALTCMDGKVGTYLDLGCQHPTEISNSCLLEELGWKGLAYDVDSEYIRLHQQRRTNKAFCQDATQLDWDFIIDELGSNINYLSLDLEPALITLKALKNIPFDRVSFDAITFEHDCWRHGNECRKESREIFVSAGYTPICSDVKNNGNPYEDWYVRTDEIWDRVKSLVSSNLEWKNILFEDIK